MSIWESYDKRIGLSGTTKREAHYIRESRMLTNKMKESLSFQTVTVDGVKQECAIIDSDNLNEKTFLSLPGEDVILGGMVEWMDEHWLITERDANSTVYSKGKMIQCNYLLKWVSDDHVIHEQWCIIEDGTKLASSFLVAKAA